MFLWQFPHFMAIAWLYRDDYARAGQRMLTVVDPTGLRAGAQAVVGALALIPVSLVPALSPAGRQPGDLLRLGARCSASCQAGRRHVVLAPPRRSSARRLLRASLVYLICWMGLLVDGRSVTVRTYKY